MKFNSFEDLAKSLNIPVEDKPAVSNITKFADRKDDVKGTAEKRDMRKLTKAAEKEITKYLSGTLFPYMIQKGYATDINTAVTSQQDLSGIDMILTAPNGEVSNIDQKAQLMYLNDPHATWSMELRYNDKNGHRVDGWFLQCMPGHIDQHKTDYLALTYIDKVDAKRLEDFTADKIKELTVLYVKVSDIVDMLKEKGLTLDVLRDEAEKASQEYRDRIKTIKESPTPSIKGKTDSIRRIFTDDFECRNGKYDAYYYVSDGKEDIDSCPVNLIIRKSVLEKLPHSMEFIVEPSRTLQKVLDNEQAPFCSVSTLKHNSGTIPFKTKAELDKEHQREEK